MYKSRVHTAALYLNFVDQLILADFKLHACSLLIESSRDDGNETLCNLANMQI
jgi:hypothetical protein